MSELNSITTIDGLVQFLSEFIQTVVTQSYVDQELDKKLTSSNFERTVSKFVYRTDLKAQLDAKIGRAEVISLLAEKANLSDLEVGIARKANVNSLYTLQKRVNNLFPFSFVENITARDAIESTERNKLVFVIDASDDTTLPENAVGAVYVWSNDRSVWVRLSVLTFSLDQVNYNSLIGKPSASAEEIDQTCHLVISRSLLIQRLSELFDSKHVHVSTVETLEETVAASHKHSELAQVDSILEDDLITLVRDNQLVNVKASTQTGSYSEFTQFEVFATNSIISAGSTDIDTGLVYAFDVPAGMTHSFRLRSDAPPETNDIIIHWGDGTSSSVHKQDYTSIYDAEWLTVAELIYNFRHTYSKPGKYIVTIYGKDYWGFQTGPFTSGGASILSRIFMEDLPLAGWVKNLAGCAAYSPKIQRVLIPTGMDMFANIHNASAIFKNNINLLSATNFETKFQWTRYVCELFSGCLSLTTSDFRLPQNAIRPSAYQRVYKGCRKLTGNIASFFPERGFDGKKVDISECFMDCPLLTGTVPGDILWNDMVTTWTHNNTFTGCSDDIRAQIPTSWGGTAAEVEDPKPITRSNAVTIIGAKVDDAITNLNISSGANAGRGNVLGGYGVKVVAYTASDPGTTPRKLTIASVDGEDLDWTKITADITIRVNDSGEVVSSGVGEDETEEDLLYLESTIKAVDSTNNYIWISPWRYAGSTEGDATKVREVSSDFSSNVADGKIFLRLADSERTDAASSSGDKNFVVGRRAYANGSWNTVTGDLSGADGALNIIPGALSYSRGVSNIINAERVVADGVGNIVNIAASLSFVIGSGNEISNQSEYVIGDMNRMSGIDQLVIGTSNTGGGNQAIIIGKNNNVSSSGGFAIGYHLTIRAKNASMVGRYGIFEDSPENEGAFAIASGKFGAEAFGFVHRSNKKILNPLYNSSLDTGNTGTDSAGEKKYIAESAYSTEYLGRFSPIASVVSIATGATIYLDHDQFTRWELTGSGTITLALENWINGDRGELLVNTSLQTIGFPSDWNTPTNFNITSTPGVYLLEIRKEANLIFFHKILPFD